MQKKESEDQMSQEMKEAIKANFIPDVEELAEMSGESVETIEELTSMESMTDPEKEDFRKNVLGDPEKVKVIRRQLRKQKETLDMKLILVDKMFPELEDPEKRAEAIENLRLKYLTEYTQIEIALYTTRQNGKFMRSSSYSFTPHVGLNRRQRRMVMR